MLPSSGGAPILYILCLFLQYVASVSVGNKTSEAIGNTYTGQVRHVREEVTFSSAHKWSGLCLDEGADQGCYILGAPEILQLSLRSGSSEIQSLVDTEAARGLRLVLFAYTSTLVALHDEHDEPSLPPQLLPLGLVSLQDVIRPEAAETLAHFAAVGVAVKIISGDSPQTVEALARQAGLSQDMAVVSGIDLAHVADIVLLNDSFGVLPHALREGRRISNGMHTVLKLFLTRVIYVALLLIATGIVGVGGFPPDLCGTLPLYCVSTV